MMANLLKNALEVALSSQNKPGAKALRLQNGGSVPAEIRKSFF